MVSYNDRLERLKSEAGSTLALWGDEFGDMLSLQEEPGFVMDPSSAFDSTTTLSYNDRAAISGGGGGSEFGKGEPWAGGQQDSADPDSVGGGRGGGGGGGVSVEGGGGEGVGMEGSGTVDRVAVGDFSGALKPRPMSIEDPEWDVEGDYNPLPAWKVILGRELSSVTKNEWRKRTIAHTAEPQVGERRGRGSRLRGHRRRRGAADTWRFRKIAFFYRGRQRLLSISWPRRLSTCRFFQLSHKLVVLLASLPHHLVWGRC